MRTPEQTANLNKLIEYYEAKPEGVPSWSYANCAMGAMHNLRMIPTLYASDIAVERLGIDLSTMNYIVAGPDIQIYNSMTRLELRDAAVAILKGERDGESVGWNGLER